jgi:hypothetical protein
MRSSNKSRSRNKNNNRRQNPGNVINRVFDSSGPEGRVRGTPQQIIDKYQSLASDAMLAGDRIAHENFLQHSEHYSRLLVTAQREVDAKKEQQQQQQQQQQKQQQNKPAQAADSNEQPSIEAAPNQEIFPGQSEEGSLVETAESGLIETPESAPKKNRRRPAKPKPEEQVSEAVSEPEVKEKEA